MKTFAFAIVASLFSGSVYAAKISTTVQQEIATIEQQRLSALLNNDVAKLQQIIHPDAVHITTDGTRRTTTQWLATRNKAKHTFSAFTLNPDTVYRVFNNIVIVDGTYTNINQRTKQSKLGRYTRAYQKVGTQWKMITHQATKLLQE